MAVAVVQNAQSQNANIRNFLIYNNKIRMFNPILDVFNIQDISVYFASIAPEPEKPRKHPSIASGKVFVVGKVFAWVRKDLIKI